MENLKNFTHGFPHPVERKKGYFGVNPKIFSKYTLLSPRVVEKSVDNVEKNTMCFPQIHVENSIVSKNANFGNEWKREC